MSAMYFDRHNKSNPNNGAVLVDGAAAKVMLLKHEATKPFFSELVFDDQTKLLVGLGPEIGCAQFTNADDEPPYLVARIESENMREGFADFVIGNEPSEVPLRLCIPLDVLLEVVAYFVDTGRRSSIVSWEEI